MKNFWHTLPKPFFALAPMENVTDTVLRQIIAKHAKPDVFFSEFTNTDGMFSKGAERVMMRLQYTPSEHPLIAQIWGKRPESFEKAAKLIRKLEFDGIDINMGCPDKSVTRNGAGSGLIKNPSLAKEIIAAVKEHAGELPVSVKTRIGFDHIQTEEWASFLLEQSIHALTVHGRTKKEMSKVSAHWDEIGKVVMIRDEIAPDTIIIGNGDIASQTEGIAMHEKYGVDGIMIGRGLFANPWIFDRDGKERTIAEALAQLVEHATLFLDTWGDKKDFFIMKKFFKAYVQGFDNAGDLRVKLMGSNNIEDVKAIVHAFLNTHSSD